jgi:hypothetical protein
MRVDPTEDLDVVLRPMTRRDVPFWSWNDPDAAVLAGMVSLWRSPARRRQTAR